MLKDHYPVTISEFGGLYDRGDNSTTPLDHFQDCENIKFIDNGAFGTRDGIAISQNVITPLSNVKRIYNYPTPTANTLIVLVVNDAGIGQIYHVVNSTLMYGPLLSIAGMTDFAFQPYAGRAYISPFTSYTVGSLNVEKGLQNEFLYVYAGDGTAARKAGGAPLSGIITVANGAAGHTDAGIHIFAFVGETLSGFDTAPFSNIQFTSASGSSVSFGNVPTAGGIFSKRKLVATKVIPTFNGNLSGYQFFFVPNATINNDTDTFLN